MTWREATVARILLLVARIVSGDATLAKELTALSNHITVGEKPEPDQKR